MYIILSYFLLIMNLYTCGAVTLWVTKVAPESLDANLSS